jgi:hypothetical protein
MTVALFKWDGLPTLREALEAIDAWEDLRPGIATGDDGFNQTQRGDGGLS